MSTAFGVTLGTLVIQGLTLKPLLQKLNLKEDDIISKEIKLARLRVLEAAVKAIEATPDTPTKKVVQESFLLQLARSEKDFQGSSSLESEKHESGLDEQAILNAIQAQRTELANLRDFNQIGETAFNQLEQELDLMELGWLQLIRKEA